MQYVTPALAPVAILYGADLGIDPLSLPGDVIDASEQRRARIMSLDTEELSQRARYLKDIIVLASQCLISVDEEKTRRCNNCADIIHQQDNDIEVLKADLALHAGRRLDLSTLAEFDPTDYGPSDGDSDVLEPDEEPFGQGLPKGVDAVACKEMPKKRNKANPPFWPGAAESKSKSKPSWPSADDL